MVGPLPPHRPHDIQPLPPRADQAGDNIPASSTHAGPLTPAMPIHRSNRIAFRIDGFSAPPASKNDPGSRSAPQARGWSAIGRYPARRPVQDKFRACCHDNRFPRCRSRGPAAGSVPARAPQVIPGATGHDHDRQSASGLVPSGPGSPAAGSARPGAPAGTCCRRRSDRMPGSGRLQSRHRGFGLGARSAALDRL